MRAMNYNRSKDWKKVMDNPLPLLQEDERIYLNVPYEANGFAKRTKCGYDPDRKLWFTGSLNANLRYLVVLYGVNKATSEKAMAMLKAKLEDADADMYQNQFSDDEDDDDEY